MVSIIIPVLNEIETLPDFIENLQSLIGDYEIIFVDGGSNDDTLSYLKFHPLSFNVVSSPKGRAIQMNTGAMRANGDILWFVHSDSRLSKNSIESIQNSIDKGYEAGSFSLYFYDNDSISMSIIAFFSNIRSTFFSSYYGDQGIFVIKSLFQKLNQFPNISLMEDYAFSKYLKPYKKTVLKTKIGTSARRFTQKGIWKTVFLMQKIKRLYKKGANPDLLRDMYRKG